MSNKPPLGASQAIPLALLGGLVGAVFGLIVWYTLLTPNRGFTNPDQTARDLRALFWPVDTFFAVCTAFAGAGVFGTIGAIAGTIRARGAAATPVPPGAADKPRSPAPPSSERAAAVASLRAEMGPLQKRIDEIESDEPR